MDPTPWIEALEEARKAFQNKMPDALSAIRRISTSILTAEGTRGFSDIAAAAKAMEQTNTETILSCMERLLTALRAVRVENAGILIIDDDPLISLVLQRKLAADNRKIFIAQSAVQAEEILAKETVSLILLDLILPDSDGRNLLIRLRDNIKTAAIPVFVLSARGGEQPRTECLALGADEFFEKPFNPDVIGRAVSAKLSRAAETARILRRDALTGLLNRAAFRDVFSHTAELAVRAEKPLALAIIDLDHFKAINDTCGHAAGDDVLRRITAVLNQSLRKSDILARWGGEEFVAAFPNTNCAGAINALEKALAVMREERFISAEGKQFQVAFSAGVVEVAKDAPVDAAIADADRFLYLAKAAGRNRVFCVANHEPLAKKRVLLAEDDAIIAKIIRHHMEREGFELSHFTDGAAAFSAATKDASISLVILDAKMPGMDGFELLEKLRKMPSFRTIPIVMLTSMGEEKDVVRGFELGANDYMVKPFSPAELLARVRRLIKHA